MADDGKPHVITKRPHQAGCPGRLVRDMDTRGRSLPLSIDRIGRPGNGGIVAYSYCAEYERLREAADG